MVLCYVVTFATVGFVFNLVGMALGWNVRNQGRILNLIEIPVQLVTSYVCFRFLAKELAIKSAEKALNDARDEQQAKKAASSSMPANKSDAAESAQQQQV
jgi:hypothetical protein